MRLLLPLLACWPLHVGALARLLLRHGQEKYTVARTLQKMLLERHSQRHLPTWKNQVCWMRSEWSPLGGQPAESVRVQLAVLSKAGRALAALEIFHRRYLRALLGFPVLLM